MQRLQFRLECLSFYMCLCLCFYFYFFYSVAFYIFASRFEPHFCCETHEAATCKLTLIYQLNIYNDVIEFLILSKFPLMFKSSLSASEDVKKTRKLKEECGKCMCCTYGKIHFSFLFFFPFFFIFLLPYSPSLQQMGSIDPIRYCWKMFLIQVSFTDFLSHLYILKQVSFIHCKMQMKKLSDIDEIPVSGGDTIVNKSARIKLGEVEDDKLPGRPAIAKGALQLLHFEETKRHQRYLASSWILNLRSEWLNLVRTMMIQIKQ